MKDVFLQKEDFKTESLSAESMVCVCVCIVFFPWFFLWFLWFSGFHGLRFNSSTCIILLCVEGGEGLVKKGS